MFAAYFPRHFTSCAKYRREQVHGTLCGWTGASFSNADSFMNLLISITLNIQIDMVRGGPGSYRLKMNQSEIEAEIHTLRDGGLLMQVSVFTMPKLIHE